MKQKLKKQRKGKMGLKFLNSFQGGWSTDQKQQQKQKKKTKTQIFCE